MQTGRQNIVIVILKGRYKSAHLKNKNKKNRTNKQKNSLSIRMLIEFNYPFVFYPKENTT